MRVLLIDVVFKRGSTGKLVYSLFSHLNSNGHIAGIAYGRGERTSEKNVYKVSSNIEVVLHAILSKLTGLHGVYSFFSTRKLLKTIDSFKPDIVHLHELHGYYVNIVTLMNYLKKRNIKVVWTFHCEYMYMGKGYDVSGKSFTNIIKAYPSSILFDFRKLVVKRYEKAFIGFDKLIITTPSKWLEKRVRRSYLNNKEIRTIYNGINTTVFVPSESGDLRDNLKINEKKVVLLVAPNLMDSRKGGKNALKILDYFAQRDDIVFIFVGTDYRNPDYTNAIFISRLENQSVLAKYYSLANVVLLTSERETFSLVTVESLSCGTPVIGFDAGAPTEIAKFPFGEFVEYGDIEKLCELIEKRVKIQKEPEFYRKYVISKFDDKIMCDKFLTLYESFVKEDKVG